MKQVPVYNVNRLHSLAEVDDQDFDKINKYKWFIQKCGWITYAYRTERRGSNYVQVLMHRQVMGLSHKDGNIIDHKDRDGLNNTRSNLWICSQVDNAANTAHTLRIRKDGIDLSSYAKVGDAVTLLEIEEAHIKAILEQCDKFEDAARILGIEESTLWRRRKRISALAKDLDIRYGNRKVMNDQLESDSL